MKEVVNEVELLKRILMDNYMDFKKPLSCVRVLTKYLMFAGCNEEKTKQILQGYISHEDIGFNTVIWNERINQSIKYTYNKTPKIIYIEDIAITLSELEKISTLNDENREKIAFCYLVHSKISNLKSGCQKYNVYCPTSEIIKESQFNKFSSISGKSSKKMKKEKYTDAIYDLIQKKYIDDFNSVGKNTNKKVLFADEDSEVAFVINNFESYINYYLRWRYSCTDQCKTCGNWFNKTSNRKKNCSNCSKTLRRTYKTKKDRLYRKYKDADT